MNKSFVRVNHSIILLIFVPVFFAFFCQSVYSQTYRNLFVLYQNQQIAQLAQELDQLSAERDQDAELLFFRTLFNADGLEAVKIYEQIYSQSEGPIKNLAAEKLEQYYYARGFYVKAAEYQKIAHQYIPINHKENPKVDDNKIRQVHADNGDLYRIQVGAFSVRKNAQELMDHLILKKYQVEIVDRLINGQTFYCVWVKGDSNLKNTEKIAKEMKVKYKLSYRIIQP